MKATTAITAKTLRELILLNGTVNGVVITEVIFGQAERNRMKNGAEVGSNYGVEIINTTANNTRIETLGFTASLTESRPLLQDTPAQFTVRNLDEVSIISSVASDIIITIL